MKRNPDTVTFTCPHCERKNLVSGEWFEAHNAMPCVFCHQTVNIEEVDFEDDIGSNTDVEFDPGYYLAPVLVCVNCKREMELFFSPLPETDEDGVRLVRNENPPEMPPEGWRALFGCLACGCVAEYASTQVKVTTLLKVSKGQYQSGSGLYRIEFPCADRGCKRPFSMYVDMGSVTPSDVISKLRQAHFRHTLPCGHALMTVPERYYCVYPIVRRLW